MTTREAILLYRVEKSKAVKRGLAIERNRLKECTWRRIPLWDASEGCFRPDRYIVSPPRP